MAIDPYRISAYEIPHRIDTYRIEPLQQRSLHQEACEIHYRINPYRTDPHRIGPHIEEIFEE